MQNEFMFYCIHINRDECADCKKAIQYNNIKKDSNYKFNRYLLRSICYYENYTVVTRLGSATNVRVLFVALLARHDNCKCMEVVTFDNNMSTRIRSSLLTGCGIASNASSKKLLKIQKLY